MDWTVTVDETRRSMTTSFSNKLPSLVGYEGLARETKVWQRFGMEGCYDYHKKLACGLLANVCIEVELHTIGCTTNVSPQE